MSHQSLYPPARAVTSGPGHHFFGYYDKCPWGASGRYMLALETPFMDRPPTGADRATVGLIDLAEGNRWQPLDETHAWNWQQGTMLQWLPSALDRLIIYNTRDGDRFASTIRDVHTGETRTLPLPIYAVSHDRASALSVNFARLHWTRPGYGYAGLPDPWAADLHPAEDGIYRMDLNTGQHRLIISLDQIARFRPNPTMDGVAHWFNHLQFNPDDTRFIFLHRWQRPDGKGWWTRLFTANPDGSDIHCAADHGMVSHFDWRNSQQILAWARQRDVGDRYFLFTDRAREVEVVGEGVLTTDGHCSYSPDGRWLLTDTYPDSEHMRTLILYRLCDGHRVDIGRFFAPQELVGEIRCDLHPRWSREGTKVCVDSAHEGSRQMYVLDVGGIVEATPCG
ncbi:MAG: hypothetical protein U9Q78_02240 [Chloroflexota bacterium]|nr:hypothetical protein [Chloroflexota bacterium]